MVTKAMYSMVSELNQPDFTEYSPRTIPAMTLKGVVSMLGVLTAARRRPSMANSRMRSCQISGTNCSSAIWMNWSQSGIHWGFCMSRSHRGVKNRVRRETVILESRRYVPVTGGK